MIAYRIDRFSRNLKDLFDLADELSSYGVGFKSATEQIGTAPIIIDRLSRCI